MGRHLKLTEPLILSSILGLIYSEDLTGQGKMAWDFIRPLVPTVSRIQYHTQSVPGQPQDDSGLGQMRLPEERAAHANVARPGLRAPMGKPQQYIRLHWPPGVQSTSARRA